MRSCIWSAGIRRAWHDTIFGLQLVRGLQGLRGNGRRLVQMPPTYHCHRRSRKILLHVRRSYILCNISFGGLRYHGSRLVVRKEIISSGTTGGSRKPHPTRYVNEIIGNRVKEYRSNIVNQLEVRTAGTKVGTICLLPINRNFYEASSLVL